MNVSLSRELEQYVQDCVASGRYSSKSEVIREALRLLQQIERSRETRQALADAKIREIEMEVFGPPPTGDFDYEPRARRRKSSSG